MDLHNPKKDDSVTYYTENSWAPCTVTDVIKPHDTTYVHVTYWRKSRVGLFGWETSGHYHTVKMTLGQWRILVLRGYIR